MKAIIPVAGIGTRLRPHTHTAPKVLLQVGGKPILAHILDELITLGIEEVTFVVGYLGELIKDYIDQNYRLKAHYVHQEELLGLGHAIWLTRDIHKDDKKVLIILGDTIFKVDLEGILHKDISHIGVKEVDEPQRFGIVEMESGYLSRVIEKPAEPKTNLAIVGIYTICNPNMLYECLDENIREGEKTKGEFQLTDALQKMLDRGEKMKPFLVEGWYDCGKPETLLQTNRYLLSLNFSEISEQYNKYCKKSIINPPVYIHPTVDMSNSIIGPYATIAEHAQITNAIITNSIIGKKSFVQNIILNDSIISDNAKAEGHLYKLNVGDASEINFS